MSPTLVSTTTGISKDENSPSPAPQKDYAAALATLQSLYGANGHAPVAPAPLPVASKKSDSSRPRRAGVLNFGGSKTEAPESEPQTFSSTRIKDFKTAFAVFRAWFSFGASSTSKGH